MYFRAILRRVIVQTKMKYHTSVLSKERQWGMVESMVFGSQKALDPFFFLPMQP